MAQIQAMLPNGTYRAMINQRNITLALPFSAKSGGPLELQVTETDGKLALAVVAPKEGESAKAPPTTTSTLSKTGQLISELFSGAAESKGKPAALPATATSQSPTHLRPAPRTCCPCSNRPSARAGCFTRRIKPNGSKVGLPKRPFSRNPKAKLSTPATLSSLPDDLLENSLQKTAATAPTTAHNATQRAETEANHPTATITASSDTGKPHPLSQTRKRRLRSLPRRHNLSFKCNSTLWRRKFSWQGQVWPGQEMRWGKLMKTGQGAARTGATAPRNGPPDLA